MKASNRSWPLPPVPRDDDHPPKKKPAAAKHPRRMFHQAASLAGRSAKAVGETPAKLMQRVNQELYKRNAELAIRNKTLALLRKLDEISLATVGMEDMAGQMSEAIALALGYDVVAIVMMHDHDKTNFVHWVGASSSLSWITKVIEGSELDRLQESVDISFLAKYLAQKENVIFADDPRLVYPSKFMAALTAADQSPDIDEVKHSMIYVLRFGQQVLGAVILSSSRPLRELTRYEQEAVSGITGLLALALYKAELYEDLQQTSHKLAVANNQLRDLDKAKSEFLSIASHQLYTPLTAIRGYLSMLREGDYGELQEKQAPVIDIINKSAERLIDLIKNLLDISRIESGRFELDLAVIDVAKMAKEIVQDLMPNAMKKNLKLLWHDSAAPVPPVIADQQRLRQVLLNFIDNSIKYTDTGHIDVSVALVGDEVEFTVTDTGKGLSAEEIPTLFTKFTRAGDASHYHTEGSGLGLYVARQIIHEHHGEVTVKSPGKGKGSTFSMRMPAENSARSLKVGDKATVVIKAAPTGTN
jgi:signal transduction histidine kinase